MDEHGKHLYAGCDVDGSVRLFKLVNGKPVALKHADWLRVLDAWKCEPGEMLIVHFTPQRKELPCS